MRTLDIHEAADLLRTRLQAVHGLKVSAAVVMWKALLWALGDLYPRYVLADTEPQTGGDVDPGGVPLGRGPGEGEPDGRL